MEKHALQKLFENVEASCRSYSGRGMYGSQCLATDDDAGIGEIMANVLEALSYDECSLNEDGLRQAADGLRKMRSDSMGMGTVYYFPGVPFVPDEEDGD